MKNTVKILSVALAALLIAACLPFTALGADATVIKTADELRAFAQAVNSGSTKLDAVLDADIDCGKTFTPIGTEENPYAGKFDGKGYGITCEFETEDDYAGIFGVTNGAEIKDLVSDYTLFDSASYTGGIAAYAVNTVISGCSVSDAYLYAGSYLGGIAGYAENCTIGNAEILSDAIIEAVDLYCGGIVGAASGSKLDACINYADVSCKSYAGGIAGSEKDSEITNCANLGAVTVLGDFCAGIASSVSGGKIENCYNAGEVKAPNGNVFAGIFGIMSSGAVSCCYNVGAVSGALKTYAGIGSKVSGTVENCCCADTAQKTLISVADATVVSCKRAAAADMKKQATFEGFDFENTWEFINNHGYEYPVLTALASIYHKLSFVSTTAPSCALGGYDSFACATCGAILKMNPTPAAGHKYKTVTSKKATCLEDGYADFLCEVCKDTYSEEYKATGHVDKNKDNKCDNCGAKIDESVKEDAKLNIFQKIANFFKKIIDWVKGLFTK